MPQKFRLTCARTSYFEVEFEAEEGVAAEQQFAAILEQNPELWKQVEAVGKPTYRLVDVVSGAEESAALGALTPRAAA
jgi:hypothetical protein